jgi:hypothetical protein
MKTAVSAPPDDLERKALLEAIVRLIARVLSLR